MIVAMYLHTTIIMHICMIVMHKLLLGGRNRNPGRTLTRSSTKCYVCARGVGDVVAPSGWWLGNISIVIRQVILYNIIFVESLTL